MNMLNLLDAYWQWYHDETEIQYKTTARISEDPVLRRRASGALLLCGVSTVLILLAIVLSGTTSVWITGLGYMAGIGLITSALVGSVIFGRADSAVRSQLRKEREAQ